MTRLEKLIKIVRAELAAALLKPSAENVESLKRCQDRLIQHSSRTGKTAPYELFFAPPVMEGFALKLQVHDELIYESER
jgi:hypothetical protein